MSFLDKTFCASPNCKNECGLMMTSDERQHLAYLKDCYPDSTYVCYGFFCGDTEQEK